MRRRFLLTVLACLAFMAPFASPGARAEKRVLIHANTQRVLASLVYPQVGNAPIDADLERFAATELKERVRDLERECDQAPGNRGKAASLSGRYTLFQPSSQALSVLFELRAVSPIWPAPRRFFASRSYRMPSGELLSLTALFEDLPRALKVLAIRCAPKLLAQLLERQSQERIEMAYFLRSRLIIPGYPMPGGTEMADFLQSGSGPSPAMRLLACVVHGTEPQEANFKHFQLTPKGLRIQFEPLQLGGPETEAPSVELNLKELQDAKPHLELWGN